MDSLAGLGLLATSKWEYTAKTNLRINFNYRYQLLVILVYYTTFKGKPKPSSDTTEFAQKNSRKMGFTGHALLDGNYLSGLKPKVYSYTQQVFLLYIVLANVWAHAQSGATIVHSTHQLTKLIPLLD